MYEKRICYYRDCEEVSCQDCKDFTSDPDLKTITITTEEFKILTSLYDSKNKDFVGADRVKEVIDIISEDNYLILK